MWWASSDQLRCREQKRVSQRAGNSAWRLKCWPALQTCQPSFSPSPSVSLSQRVRRRQTTIFCTCVHMPTARRLWGALTKTTQEQSRERVGKGKVVLVLAPHSRVFTDSENTSRAGQFVWNGSPTARRGGTSRTANS